MPLSAFAFWYIGFWWEAVDRGERRCSAAQAQFHLAKRLRIVAVGRCAIEMKIVGKPTTGERPH